MQRRSARLRKGEAAGSGAAPDESVAIEEEAPMFDVPPPSPDLPKGDLYDRLRRDLTALFTGERDPIANAANMAALLFHSLPDLNWAGFYVLLGDDLVLGPFQGKPACVRIAAGRGICGAAVARGETLAVPDVHAFPGHIACDGASQSELVAPLWREGRIAGVLDLDSPRLNRFDEADRRGCETLAALFMAASDPF